MNVAKYALLLINPTIDRLDTVVAGAVFKSEKGWDVRVASTSQKMRAIDPSFPEEKLTHTYELALREAKRVDDLSQLKSAFKVSRLGIKIDEFVGEFAFDDEADYQSQIAAVLAESVNPPTIALANVAPVSRRRNIVQRNLRDQFKGLGLWSRKSQDISKHCIVENYPVSVDHGMHADFALRNGVMHITETIDFEVQSSAKGKKQQAQAKTLVLIESAKIFGDGTKSYAVVAGSSRSDVQQSVNLLTDHATVFALESAADMKVYIDKMAELALATN
jgi:hypothetical protein